MPLIGDASNILLGTTPVNAIYARNEKVYPLGVNIPVDTAFTVLINRVWITKSGTTIHEWTFADSGEGWIYRGEDTVANIGDIPWQEDENPWVVDEYGFLTCEVTNVLGSGYISFCTPTIMPSITPDQYTVLASVTLGHIDKSNINACAAMLEVGANAGPTATLNTIGQTYTISCYGYVSADPTDVRLSIGAYFINLSERQGLVTNG